MGNIADALRNFSNVLCYKIGGCIYGYSAKYKDVYLYGRFDESIYSLPIRGEVLDGFDYKFFAEHLPADELQDYGRQKTLAYNIPHDNYQKVSMLPSDGILPTWMEILYSVRYLNRYKGTDIAEAERAILYCNPDANKRIDEDE